MEIRNCSWKFTTDHGNSQLLMEVHNCSWKFTTAHANSQLFAGNHIIMFENAVHN